MAIKLNPELGQRLATELTEVFDKKILDAISEEYNAVKKLGEDTTEVQLLKEKFKKFEQYYNDEFVPALNAAKKELEAYTDLSEYMVKIQVNTDVKAVDVGTVAGGAFDAAKQL